MINQRSWRALEFFYTRISYSNLILRFDFKKRMFIPTRRVDKAVFYSNAVLIVVTLILVALNGFKAYAESSAISSESLKIGSLVRILYAIVYSAGASLYLAFLYTVTYKLSDVFVTCSYVLVFFMRLESKWKSFVKFIKTCG